MIRNGAIAVSVLAVMVLSGCGVHTPGTTRVLGDVEYAAAFAKGREVMGQHFSVASADAGTGMITSRPHPTEVRGKRLLGSSPTRHLATLRIRRKDGQVAAHASVALQREGSSVHRVAAPNSENYDSVPNLTPADESAAITPEQNEAWRTDRYDHALERKILEDLYKALHPGVK